MLACSNLASFFVDKKKRRHNYFEIANRNSNRYKYLEKMRSTIAVILLSSLFSLIQANNGSALHIHTNGKKSTFRKLSITNKIPRGPLTARKPRRAKSQSRSQTATRTTPTPGPAHASPSQLPSLNPSEPPSLKSYNKSKSATSSFTMKWKCRRSQIGSCIAQRLFDDAHN